MQKWPVGTPATAGKDWNLLNIEINLELLNNILMMQKWPVRTPATAGCRDWCPHQPQYGKRKFHF